MLNLNAFSHNHHPPRVKMLPKYIRRGISVGDTAVFKAAPKILLKGGVIGSAITATLLACLTLGIKGIIF